MFAQNAEPVLTLHVLAPGKKLTQNPTILCASYSAPEYHLGTQTSEHKNQECVAPGKQESTCGGFLDGATTPGSVLNA